MLELSCNNVPRWNDYPDKNDKTYVNDLYSLLLLFCLFLTFVSLRHLCVSSSPFCLSLTFAFVSWTIFSFQYCVCVSAHSKPNEDDLEHATKNKVIWFQLLKQIFFVSSSRYNRPKIRTDNCKVSSIFILVCLNLKYFKLQKRFQIVH